MKRSNGKRTSAVVEGHLSLENIASLRESLLEAFEKADDVVYRTGPVVEKRFACVQLLCSTCRYAARLDKGFSLVSEDRPALLGMFRDARFGDASACGLGVEDCFVGQGDEFGPASRETV